MTTKLVSLKVRAMKRFDQDREAGQGALEYVGMVAVAALVVVTLLGLAGQWDLGTIVSNAITSVSNAAG